jgi:hypothetical protein
MKAIILNLPTLAFVVSTRAALAGGIGLLLSDKLPATRRRAIGVTLVAVGAAATIPAAFAVMRGFRRSRGGREQPGVRRDPRLIGTMRYPRSADEEFV